MTATITKQAELPVRWQALYDLFRWYCRTRYAPAHFSAVRIAKFGQPPKTWAGPCVVVMNHPSWWDAVTVFLLSGLFPGREDWGPIEASGLQQYKFLERMGLYGITATPRGAVKFLQVSRAIVAKPTATLWMFPQGGFTDARVRPVVLKSGTGKLLAEMNEGVVLPVALEYSFWDERTPEALVWFGDPISITPRSGEAWTTELATRLEECQDRLAAVAMTRDPSHFTTLVAGKVGVGGVYDAWRRFKAFVSGQAFRASHSQRTHA